MIKLKVIAISGRAQHGKDTTAMMLRDELQRKGYSVCITHYGDLLKYICTTYFDWDGKKDEIGRGLLQNVGTEIVRTQMPDFWVDFIKNIITLFNNKWDYMIIADARFPNEISGFEEIVEQFTHIRINRQTINDKLTNNQRNHSSETALLNIKPDFYIHNNGTLEDLKTIVHDWVEETIVDDE